MGRKSDQTVTWNQTAIKRLPTPPKGSRATYHHPENHRLVVILTDTGTRTFYYVARVDRRQQRILIGRFPGCTPKAAVKAAEELEPEVAKGVNPHKVRRDERRARDAAPTLAEYWEHTFQPQHVASLKPSTQGQYGDTWKNHLAPALGDLKLADITRADVRDMHATIGASGRKRAANLAVAVLRCMINHAIDQEHLAGPNPADRIKLYPETRHERFLSRQEIARLYVVLQEGAQQHGDWTMHDLIKLALLTGARRSNLLAMRWEHLDLEHGRWSIPRSETKSARPYLVALPPGAVEILRQRRQADPEGAYVFPAKRKGAKGTPHLVRFKTAWDRIRKQAGLTDVRFHDLRHTSASLLANHGASLQVIGHQLGHSSVMTTQRYAHLVADTVAAAVTAATDGLGDQE